MAVNKYHKLAQLTHLPYGSVLKSKNEYIESVETLDKLNLPLHGDVPKNWDSLAALAILCRTFGTREECDLKHLRVLDAGGEYYSVVLPHLAQLGFEQLYCLNLSFNEPIQNGPINYLPGDITQTAFDNNFFDAVVCLSVIEHGIPLNRFFKEMKRIIRPGGLLIVSADYWDKPLDTGGKMAYGVPVKIFSRDDIVAINNIAAENDFNLIELPELDTKDATVRWLDLDFTFVYLSFTKLH